MDKLNRRDFLRMSAVAAAGAVVAACAKQTAAPTTGPAATATAVPQATNTTIPTRAATNTPVPTPVEVKEPPVLSDMVKAGTLPPLAERRGEPEQARELRKQNNVKLPRRSRARGEWGVSFCPARPGV